MDEYKGIYYGEKKEKQFYEGGAHFRYKDLYRILKILGGEIEEKNEIDSNSIDFNNEKLSMNNNIMQKVQSRNNNKFNYMNNPNTKVSIFSISNNENKPLLFQKINLKNPNSNNNSLKDNIKRPYSNIKLRSFRFERVSNNSLNKYVHTKNLSLNQNKSIKNLKMNSLSKNLKINLHNHNIHITNKNKLFNNQIINNNIHTIYDNRNYFDNNHNNKNIYIKKSRNNFNQSHVGYVKTIDLNNKVGLNNGRSTEGINFNKTLSHNKLEKTTNDIFDLKKKKLNDYFIIFPRKDTFNNNMGNFNLGITILNNHNQKNFRKNFSSIYK